ncbi:MAG: carboxypeptidase regulatory-like domain-containing protein [Gemmatimonadota bacterium]
MRTRTLLVSALAVALWAVGASARTGGARGAGTGTAQAVTGTVTDADDGRPIDGAAVMLFDTTAVALDSTATDTGGRFHLDAPHPGRFVLVVRVPNHLSYSDLVDVGPGEVIEHAVEMPLISTAAARVMHEVIDREAALQLPLEELCREPIRPWEAGLLVGVARDRSTLQPVPRAAVTLEPPGDEEPDGTAVPEGATGASEPSAVDAPSGRDGWPRTRVATATGAFWFCNVPPGRARVVARSDGYVTGTYLATIRAGTISWYDALLRPER